MSDPFSPSPPPPGGGSRRTPDRPCLNCGDPTPGNYCRNCGQRKVEIRVSLRRMLMEALDDQFALSSALPRTLTALFLRPGRLTRDYMDGRIARYIPPLRLYLISSLLFFLVLSIDLSSAARQPAEVRVRGDSSQAATGAGAQAAAARGDSAAPDTNWIGSVRVNTGISELDSLVTARIGELRRMGPREAMKRVGTQFREHVPQTIFLLLPLYAALLKLLYLRRKRLYVEHFVFALHLHAFAFLMFTVMLVVSLPLFRAAGLGWIMIYTFLAMHRVYGQGWITTAVKWATVGFVYATLLSAALALTLLATVALM